jgi:hypothetical protein
MQQRISTKKCCPYGQHFFVYIIYNNIKWKQENMKEHDKRNRECDKRKIVEK